MIVKNACTLFGMSKVTERIFFLAERWPPRARRSKLAKICGVSAQAVRDWEEGKTKNIRHDHMVKIAAYFDVSVDWLLTGVESTRSAGDTSSGLFRVTESSVRYAEPAGDVPLISWVQAGAWDEAIDPHEPGYAEDYLPCVVPHSARTFAVRVEGDSMTSPTGRSYPHGTILFVDPEQRGGVVPGDRIIAKLNGDDKVTFKQLAEDRQGRYLKPLNPAHEPIYGEFRVLGKVIGAWLME